MQLMKKNVLILFFTISLVLFSASVLPLYAAWSPPLQISAGPSSTNPSGTPLVINSNSIALVGWLDGPIGVAQTLSSATLLPQSVVWTAPQSIYTNTIPGLFPSFPTLSQDIFGGSVAAFGTIDPINGTIIINASRRATTFDAWPAPITEALNGSPVGASLAVDELGNVAALFAITTNGFPPFDITLIQLPADSPSWLSPIILAQDNSSQPAVAAKTHLENATLAWKVNTPSLQLQTLRFNFLTQQPSSIINVPLPLLTTDILAMDIAVDSQGDAIIIYLAQFGVGNALYSSTLLAGQNTWSNPLLISDPANTVIGASIASDAVGNTTILWGEQITPTQQFVRVATLPLGGVPIFVTDLTNRNMLNTTVDSTSRVVMDSFGNAAAIWGITMGGTPMVQVSSKAVEQNNWTTPETLSVSGSFPLITLSDQGTAVATWIDSVTNILMGSRNLFLFTLRPPSNFVGQIIENISPQGTSYSLAMSWNPSPAPNIVSYEIFQNGILIATVPGSGPFTFVQPLTSTNIQGIYTLVAIASNGNSSVPIPLILQPLLAPPSNFVGQVIENISANGTSYFLSMSWNPSPAPNIVSYEIFQDGVLIATVPGSGPFTFVQPLTSRNIQGVYTLVAIASNGSRSLSIPLIIQPALASPSNFVGKVIKNEFVTDTTYFLKMQWNPSPALNIVNYEIFKNGKLIATIPGNGPFKLLQPLHCKCVEGDYILIAIASNGSKSLSIPLVVKRK